MKFYLTYRDDLRKSPTLREILNAFQKAGAHLVSSPKEADYLVVVGGDGTLLRAVPVAYQWDLPIVGINLGRLGFITEVAPSEVETLLEKLLSGEVEVEERMAFEVVHEDEWFCCLNEVAVLKGPLGHMIRLTVRADGAYLTTYYGDGLLVSTPTGSTAYNLSAGGPIIHPKTEALVITPICPFMLSARPLVLPSNLSLEVTLSSPSQEVHLLVDGRINRILAPERSLFIKKAERPIKLVTSPTRNYFDILRNKLGWGESKL